MHCHLDLYPDPFKVVQECREREIYILSVTTTPKAWDGTNKLAFNCERIRTALGLHPQLAHLRAHELELFDSILPNVKYVGEIGLDGSKDFRKHWEIQLNVFRHILQSVNREGGRVMSIHCRSSASAILDELKNIDGVPILHWFSGTQKELKRAVDMGCWFSVGPAMLKTKKGLELVSAMPMERIITETDGPFTKFNGKLLFPWDVELAIEQLSKLWHFSEEEVEEYLVNNFKYLLLNQN